MHKSQMTDGISHDEFRLTVVCTCASASERNENGAKSNKIQELPFGPLLDDKQDLEGMLRRAQLAILNPHLPANFFEDLDSSDFEAFPPDGAPRQLQFSPNLVCIDISVPDLTNLSLIDLPDMYTNFPRRNKLP